MKKILLSALLLSNILLLAACSDDDDDNPPPPSIVISGVITSAADSSNIENAQVTIIDVETQEYEFDPYITGTDGSYSFSAPDPGTYEIRVSAQGFTPSPLDGVAGIPIKITTENNVALKAIEAGNYGALNIELMGYEKTVGALLILSSTTNDNTYTAVTNNTGELTLFNLLADTYTLTIKSIGHETHTHEDVTIMGDDAVTSLTEITLTAIDGFTVGGTVTFLATGNAEVDVSLTYIDTAAVMPGTNVMTTSAAYTIAAVAPGSYNILATSKIDGLVVDPDSIVKHGQPTVTVVDANITADGIDVTGAVSLTSPIAQESGAPATVDTLTPPLKWEAYSSSSDYVIEVLDVNGTVIWGGFSTVDGLLTKNLTTTETSMVYASDTALVDGESYRWKIYASKNDKQEATGWKLISSSEDAQGVFTVMQDTPEE